ncbi:hypothetical protein [Humidisolicoccus flavus]|uniref:hypothetical protein n=1 Tax=Humidisolicoccus flavus TaxID=3111414 RepID=UPI00325362EB
MQIGTRWKVGEAAPGSLSAGVRASIAAEERTLVELGAETGDWYWTLTWLESRPQVVLDDGTLITERDGEVLITREDD